MCCLCVVCVLFVCCLCVVCGDSDNSGRYIYIYIYIYIRRVQVKKNIYTQSTPLENIARRIVSPVVESREHKIWDNDFCALM